MIETQSPRAYPEAASRSCIGDDLQPRAEYVRFTTARELDTEYFRLILLDGCTCKRTGFHIYGNGANTVYRTLSLIRSTVRLESGNVPGAEQMLYQERCSIDVVGMYPYISYA